MEVKEGKSKKWKGSHLVVTSH